MLSMLKGAEARGLPDAAIERVAFQGAPDGHPLDDVIVHGRMPDGAPATLEIQVKRGITFAPKDKVFKDVVEQIAEATKKAAFTNEIYELAVATSKATGPMGSYQELLSRVRSHASAAAFFRHLNLCNEDQRTFVKTLRTHLKTFGADDSDEAVWRVLSRFQILYFDFTAPGSGDEAHARGRCVDLLHADTKRDAANFWDALVIRAGVIAADGGDATTASITEHFRGRFRFEGDDRYHAVRAAVSEASAQALDDIATNVLGFTLPRTRQIEAVRAAIGSGQRFIEIRGEAGVGKSAILKRFALEVMRESRVLAVAPGRVPAGGWDALKARLVFGGGIDAFLRDLASDGGGWLFIDNLDFFEAGEQKTINDLLRAAANVPGFTVVATARERFGLDDASWLDASALTVLGRAKPVIVGPIKDDELEQLREAEPRLRRLLAPDHPANAVTRNLYLLSRLLKLPEGEPLPRTEIDMSTTWWTSAAGDAGDATARTRGRVLRDLGLRAIRGEVTFDVTALDDAAINALVESETLRDFGNDRVAFRHDVLREWAIANVLSIDAVNFAGFDLKMRGSPAQLRGLELAARIALEAARDPAAWRGILDAVSGPETHAAWRRAVLLAPIHTEVTQQSIVLMGDTFLADDAALLRELIPIMTAVEVRPIRDLVPPGVDPSLMPENYNIPVGPAWTHLVSWVLLLGTKLPNKAVPEVVELYIAWCSLGMLYPDTTLTPLVLTQFKIWLTQIETAADWDDWRTRRDQPPPFGGALSGDQLKRIEDDMRAYLSLLAMRVPDVAKQYLTHVHALKRKDGIYHSIMKMRGTLAQAAPDELAEATLDYLRKPQAEKDDERRERRRPSTDGALAYADKDFLQAAPSQGPFYDLLKHAPQVGLRLIRTLVDEVIAFHTEGKAPADDDAFTLDMPGGARRFSWLNTYMWSDHSYYYSVTSALMALEAWAHERAENGEDIGSIIADIIGEGETPAAYLLVALHVILSHWPRSAAAGVPFIGCPELLSFDISRPVRTMASGIDLFGLGRLSKEPANGPRLAALKQRVSRRVSVDALIPRYALHASVQSERDDLRAVLQRAQQRLGPHQPDDDRSDPRLMVYLALNMLDASNWVEEPLEDDESNKGWRYNPPAEEVAHFEPLQARVAANNSDLSHTTAISKLLDDPSEGTPEAAAALVKWAEAKLASNGETPEAIDQAIVGAAMIAMRDGAPELRREKLAWAESQFARALTEKPDVARRMRDGILYNPVAMAFAGRIFALRGSAPTPDDLKRILTMVIADPAAARGAPQAAATIDALDPRLRRSILRVAFASSAYFWHPWDVDAGLKAQADDNQKKLVDHAIAAELLWLKGEGAEPTWPLFAEGEIRTRGRRRGIRIGVPREPDPVPERDVSRRFVDHQTAALWLSALLSKADVDKPWMAAIENAYAAWTFAANGAGFPEDEDVEAPDEWNSAFFTVMTVNFRAKSLEEIETALRPIFALNDDRFFDLTENVLYKIDVLFFNDKALAPDVAVPLRGLFADRLAKSYGFQRLRSKQSDGMEMRLGPAVATVFMSVHNFGQAPRCYLPAGFIDSSLVFTPLLLSLAERAPCVFVGMCVMSWAEVAPTSAHLSLVVAFAAAALEARADDKTFWSDHGMGARISKWLSARLASDPASLSQTASVRPAIDAIVARLVAMGVAEARRLEIALAAEQ
jgi:hypothetical protein